MEAIDRHSLEAILGTLPANVTQPEVAHVEAIAHFIQTGDAKRIDAIDKNAVRLLRVKFTDFRNQHTKDFSTATWIPANQLLAAMDLQLRKLDSKASAREKMVYALIGAAIAIAAAAVRELFR